jgi:hypothetical protein
MEASNSSNYFHFPHVTKQDYDRAFNNARNDALKDPELTPTSAARIYHVKEEALRKSVFRARRKQRNSDGLYNTHGGNNKVLNEAQEEAIRQYCYEQWDAGLGATHQMVFAAISHLKAVCSLIYLIRYTQVILIYIGSVSSKRPSFQRLVRRLASCP